MFVDGGESVKRTDLEMGVVVVAVAAGVGSLLLVCFVRSATGPFGDEDWRREEDDLSCCAAVKSDERDGSFGCEMLSVLLEKPRNCAVRSSYWLCRVRICSLW